MNTIVLQLALLFLPGIIWERIHATYVLKDKPEQFDIIRRAFVFGVISYALTFAAYSGLHRRFYIVTLDGDRIAFSIKIAREIAYATLIAFVMALAHLAFDSGKFFSKFVRKARLTDRYGTEDIWSFPRSRWRLRRRSRKERPRPTKVHDMADHNDQRGDRPGARADGQYREHSGVQRPTLAQKGSWREKGGFNQPNTQPAVRPAPPPPMTTPAASATPPSPPRPSSPRSNWFGPRRG